MPILTFPMGVRSRVRSRVFVCIRDLRNAFTAVGKRLGQSPPVKIQTKIRVYVRVYESVPVERSGSGVELRALDYEKPDSNHVIRC